MAPIQITHYSDVLCVWAYVSQARIDELQSNFGDKVELDFRFVNVFGNAWQKIESGWAGKGGFAAYGRHVAEVADQFGHVSTHPDIWVKDAPHSSLASHLVLCAVRLLEKEGQVESGTFCRFAWSLREAFFMHLADISHRSVLLELGEQAGAPAAGIEERLETGQAHAALAEDIEMARDQQVRASPTMLFNEGRQKLTGNVGYRIIEANIRELLEGPRGQHSWC